MITEIGKVISIKEVEGEILVQVECISKSACSSCHSQTSCGVGAVSKAFSDKSQYFEMPFKKGMEVDQYIELNISSSDLIKSASLVYLLPLFFFIGSAMTIKGFFVVSEGVLITVSAIFAALGFIITRFVANKLYPQKQTNHLIKTQFDK